MGLETNCEAMARACESSLADCYGEALVLVKKIRDFHQRPTRMVRWSLEAYLPTALECDFRQDEDIRNLIF